MQNGQDIRLHLIDDAVRENAQEREDRILREAKAVPLVAKWCDCDEDTGFRCYPRDGECRCGVYKHHVHGTCGHITQVG